MKIIALQGSPRPKGNTQALLEIALEAAAGAGAQVEVVQLSELTDLTGCRECFGCQSNPDEPGCLVEDDMQPLLARILAANVLVLATPVFCWSASWLLKMAVDRMYCMFKFGDGDYRSLLEGRRLAVVITEGNSGSDLITESFRRMAELARCQWLGSLVATGVGAPDDIRGNAETVERARAFGRRLVG